MNFSSDTAGTATILKTKTSVDVVFSTPLDTAPVVNITPVGIIGGQYGVKDVTEKGFTIVIDPAQSSDTVFNWTALQSAGSNDKK